MLMANAVLTIESGVKRVSRPLLKLPFRKAILHSVEVAGKNLTGTSIGRSTGCAMAFRAVLEAQAEKRSSSKPHTLVAGCQTRCGADLSLGVVGSPGKHRGARAVGAQIKRHDHITFRPSGYLAEIQSRTLTWRASSTRFARGSTLLADVRGGLGIYVGVFLPHARESHNDVAGPDTSSLTP